MSLFEKNIETLKIHSPFLAEKIEKSEIESQCEIIESKKGYPTLKIRGYLYHSIYDPVYEGKSIVRNFLKDKNTESYSSLIIIGIGLGYHVEEFLKSGIDKVIVIEKNFDILRSVFSASDLTYLLDHIKLFSLDSQDEKILLDEIKPLCGDNPLIYFHPPLQRMLSKDQYENIVNKLTRFEYKDFRGLKVMVTYPLYGGSYPVAEYTSRAFEKIGCRVEKFDMSKFYPLYKQLESSTANKNNSSKLTGLFLSLIEEIFVSRVLETRPGLIFSLAQSPIGTSVINRIKPLKIPLCYWFVEDFRLMDYWRSIALTYDHFFTIQKGDFHEELSRSGAKNYHYLPTACDPEAHKPVSLSESELSDFQSDISFMGAGYYNRRMFFKKLSNYNFKIWGTEWPLDDPYYASIVQRNGTRISIDDTAKIYNASAININLHSSTYHSSVNPYGDFINPRTFEIAACGGFQLVDHRNTLNELFIPGEEIEFFKDINELKDKIDFYLEHPEERRLVAGKARNRVLLDHTYEKRMCDVLKIISSGKGVKLEKPSTDINSYDNLINNCSKDEECLNFLTKFRDYDRVSIKDIAEEIKKGKGDLSQSEKIFLMMNEFI